MLIKNVTAANKDLVKSENSDDKPPLKQTKVSSAAADAKSPFVTQKVASTTLGENKPTAVGKPTRQVTSVPAGNSSVQAVVPQAKVLTPSSSCLQERSSLPRVSFDNDVWIGGIPTLSQNMRLVEHDLHQLMSKFGRVSRVKILKGKWLGGILENTKPCHARVSFAESAAARAAAHAKVIRFTNYDVFLSVKLWTSRKSPVQSCEKELEVSNLPFISDGVKADLGKIFRRYGIIQHIHLQDKTDRSFKPQVSAYIAFDKEESIDAALRADPIHFYGKYLLKLTKSEGRAEKADSLQKGKIFFLLSNIHIWGT